MTDSPTPNASDITTCPRCEGSGVYSQYGMVDVLDLNTGEYQSVLELVEHSCSLCDGTGKLGTIDVEELPELPFDRGVDDGPA